MTLLARRHGYLTVPLFLRRSSIERGAADLTLLLRRAACDADLDATVIGAAATRATATDGGSEVGTLVQITEHLLRFSLSAAEQALKFGGRQAVRLQRKKYPQL